MGRVIFAALAGIAFLGGLLWFFLIRKPGCDMPLAITTPRSVIVGEPVEFTSTDAGTWTFEGKQTEGLAKQEHTFTKAGKETVMLTTSDGCVGNVEVTVAEPPPPPAPDTTATLRL